ncbi:MAG TPA: adenylate/guanylate cyclase domain-containing protein [Alphaproteobacteria bacterium]|nr:adenylate/guanylate cyclase domain-containing protein [Alphaproteobacteria bacterium]
MRCPSCRSDNPERASFCGNCGARLSITCAGCGAVNLASVTFCTSCGLRLDARAAPSAAEARSPQAAARTRLPEDERKEVSVLFADISGSLGLIVDRDPETADAILSEIIAQLVDAVHRYGGTVNKMRGDGIMALFGAPVAQEDHAARACYAAMAMREIDHRRLRLISEGFDIPVKVRVGLNSGEAVVRKMSDDFAVGYDAVGEIVHLASRMEQTAAPGTIRLTAATLRLVPGLVETRPLGRLPIKGLAQPIEVHELAAIHAPPSSVRPLQRRELTRFVNREGELAGLDQALAEAAQGRGQLVALVGEAGFGKSRLLAEFVASSGAAAWRVLKGESYSYDKLTSYLPFVRIFRSFFGIGRNDDTAAIRAKVLAGLGALPAELGWAVPAFFNLHHVEGADNPWAPFDASERRQRLIDAIRSVLLLASRVQPLILILEDLHWIDVETQAVIDQIVESLPRAAILCIVTYRPEYRHGWGGKSYYRQFYIGPLREHHAALLLQALIGSHRQVERLKQMLLERMETNPFYLEECVYSLVDDQAFAGEPGAYRLTGAIDTLRIPGTVKAVLAARIDRLKPVEKRILQAAAVIGEIVPLPVLRRVADCPEPELREALKRLQETEFLHETQLLPEPEYRFRHHLTHEVTYGGLLRERRRALHTRAVEAIETLFGERAEEFAESLLRHAAEGGVWDKVAQYGSAAGIKAAWRSANQKAVTFFDQALAALQHLPDDAHNRSRALDLRLHLWLSLFQLGRLEAGVDNLSEARELAERIGDQSRLARVLMFLNHVFWLMGRQDSAVAMGEKALALAQLLKDEEREARTRFHIGISYLAWCEFRRAIAAMRETMSYCRKAALSSPLGSLTSMTLGYMARAHAELGEFDEAAALASEGVEIADAEGRPISTIIAYFSAGYVRLQKGEHEEAIPLLERGLELCRVNEARVMTPIAQGFLGAAYTGAGRAEEGAALLAEAVEAAAGIKLMLYQPFRLAQLGRAYLASDQAVAAKSHAVKAEALASEQRDPAARAEALLLLGEIEFRGGGFDAARVADRYREALGIAEALGMQPLAGHCHRLLAEVASRAGDEARAAAAREAARAVYSRLGMTRWLDRLGGEGR